MSRSEKTQTLQPSKLPNVIPGGRHADARGILRFCNDFDMSEVKRFYTVSNSAEQPQRGWIMHKRETKWFFPMRGVTRIVVQVDSSSPRKELSYLLDSEKPQVLEVPPGHWFLIDQSADLQPSNPPTLQPSSPVEVQVFSNCKVGEFPNDDFRRDITNQ